MGKLFEAQLVAMREAVRKATHNLTWVQFTAVGLGSEAQVKDTEKEEVEDLSSSRHL